MFDFDESEFRRRNLRIPGYDYTQDGAYFVTICAEGGRHLFGGIQNGLMQSNEFGKIVIESWKWLIHSHSFLNMDYFIVMPNHFHGILNICGGRRGRSRTAPTDPAPNTTVKPVGRLIAIFKTITTKQINILKGTPGGKLWQRNYYEHVVRNEDALRRIREYIQNNPLRWHLDRENFEKIDSDPFDAWLDSFKLKHRITRRG